VAASTFRRVNRPAETCQIEKPLRGCLFNQFARVYVRDREGRLHSRGFEHLQEPPFVVGPIVRKKLTSGIPSGMMNRSGRRTVQIGFRPVLDRTYRYNKNAISEHVWFFAELRLSLGVDLSMALI